VNEIKNPLPLCVFPFAIGYTKKEQDIKGWERRIRSNLIKQNTEDRLMGAYSEEKLVDPVCGMEITRGDPDALVSTYKGRSYYFCAPCCARAFQKNPERYL
jgi:YHS domain-containing protein